MSSTEETMLPRDFAGTVRLFPLPNLVLFPHVVQPLHIFEPRYCEMLEEALASDGLIAMVLLEPGWERDYEGRPAIAPVACLGKILSHEQLPAASTTCCSAACAGPRSAASTPPSGRFARPTSICSKTSIPRRAPHTGPVLQRRLVDLARELMPDKAAGREQLDDLLASQVSLGMLTDIFSYTLGFPLPVKQRLLAEWNVDRRAKLLSDHLSRLTQRVPLVEPSDEPTYPPRFSLNLQMLPATISESPADCFTVLTPTSAAYRSAPAAPPPDRRPSAR